MIFRDIMKDQVILMKSPMVTMTLIVVIISNSITTNLLPLTIPTVFLMAIVIDINPKTSQWTITN